MQTYSVLLHVFVSLLMCDYGMSNTTSLPLEESLTTRSINLTSNMSMTTAELTTLDNTASYTPIPHFTNETNQDYSAREDNEISTSTAVNPTRSVSPGMKISKDSSGHSAAGVIILILILILIIILVAILYILRKKGKSYSFDLTRTSGYVNEYDAPLRDLEQQAPVISFEHKDKDLPACLDYVQDNKSQENSSPIANGRAEETTGITTALESEKKNLPEENSFPSSPSLIPPMKKVEFNLDLDLISGESELNSPTPSDACDAAHNENNNNIISHTGCGRAEAIFTDISLDESKEHT